MVMVSFHHRESRKNGPIAGDPGSVSALNLKKHHFEVHQEVLPKVHQDLHNVVEISLMILCSM